MKHLLLSEGRRDVKLVTLFYEDIDPSLELDTFYGEEIDHDRFKGRETRKIRNFLEARNPYDVLAKSENGKSNLKTAFVKLINYLGSQTSIELTVVIDLDGGSPESLVEDLDTRVRDNYAGQSLGIRPAERIARSDAQLALRAELLDLDQSEPRGAFNVVAFRHTLERAAGITAADDARAETEKLQTFLQDDTATGPMRSALM